MNALLLLIIGIAILLVGYVFYGRYLCKQWGVGEGNLPTPAHTMEDGVDYVPAKAPVLMGHHFSSIAGAGPITGPIAASVFGWVPVFLWIIVGGIFFGGVHDFGALFASIRHGGKSIGEIISVNMSKRAKRLFIIFSYLTLILVVAAFASIVAGTFGKVNPSETVTAEAAASATAANASVAMVSLLFIVVAIVFGFMVYRRNAPMGVASILGVAAICICMAIGMNFHPIVLSTKAWMIIVGIYIAIASVTPVWILLQPRDYLSSFLLYAMLIIAVVGIIGAHPSMEALPAFSGFNVKGSYLFPVLFTTVACGAISGFHSLVSSGTTSKQLDKETDAKPIAYGGMLIECALAIITLCAVAYARKVNPEAAGVPNLFAGGIAGMVAAIPGLAGLENVLKTLLILTYSAFCLTSLDTATRLARFMFQEFWLDEGETHETATGYKKVLTNPYIATLITVVLGIALGMKGWDQIWPLFGAANQLLAGLGLLAVATWLSNIGRNNKMFIPPMIFMIIVTISSLGLTVKNKVVEIAAGGAASGAYVQAVLGTLLIVLAIVLCIEGIQTMTSGKKKKNA